MLTPRDYQQAAYLEAINYCRKTDAPGLLKIGTAGGKSLIVALIAHHVKKAGKKVLCLAPNADLVEQNAAKFRATGEQCAIFCASLGKKNTGHDVVFASPLSVVKNLERFENNYALIISDESQGVSEIEDSAYQKIFAHLRAHNPKLRIVGLTATDSRFKTKLVSEKTTFKDYIYSYEHRDLARDGWVVPYAFGVNHEAYDTSKLKVRSHGKFDQKQVDEITLGNERLTRAIIADAISIMDAQGRKCAMVFAASVRHAEEIVSYLPPGSAKLLAGKMLTKKNLRANILDEARAGKLKFLVTVDALSVGTDVPICDTIITLRPTESAGKYVQQLGRACRLYCPNWMREWGQMNRLHPRYDGKEDALVLDYAHNIERFAMSDDVTITGLVELKDKADTGDYFEIACPDCGHNNRSTAIRCTGILADHTRCEYRYLWKLCDECGTKNSPTARYCRIEKCAAELIDPNAKLQAKAAIAAGKAFHVDVMDMVVTKNSNLKSGEMVRLDFRATAIGRTFNISEFLKPHDVNNYQRRKFDAFARVTRIDALRQEGHVFTVEEVVNLAPRMQVPFRLTIRRKKGSKYYDVIEMHDS